MSSNFLVYFWKKYSSKSIKNNGMDTDPCEVSMKDVHVRTYLGILFPKNPLLASITKWLR